MPASRLIAHGTGSAAWASRAEHGRMSESQETGCTAVPEEELVDGDINSATARIPSGELPMAKTPSRESHAVHLQAPQKEERSNSNRSALLTSESRPESSLELPHEPSKAHSRLSSKGDEQSRLSPAKHQRVTTGSKGKTSSRGEIRFPITDVEPASPRVVLPEKRVRDWQSRMQSTGGRVPEEDGLDGDDDQKAEWEPTLEWYADQLLAVCGRALISSSARVISLQARHSAGLAQLDEGEQMWHLLLEVITLFAAADYHITRAAEVLRQEVGTLLPRRGSSSSTPARQVSGASSSPARRLSGGANVADNGPPSGSQVDKSLLPTPPFMPRGADAALADLHLHVARLQSSGPQLAATLRHLAQGRGGDAVLDVQRLLEAMSIRGCKGAFGQHSFGTAATEEKDNIGRLQTLFMAVPCIEEAVDRLGTLVCLVERSQAVSARAAADGSRSSRKPKANTGEGVDDDQDFIQDDDGYDEYGVGEMNVIAEEEESQGTRPPTLELIEAAAIAEAPKPSVKASGRPQSARRGSRPLSADRGPGSPLSSSSRQGNEENNPSPQAPPEAIPHTEIPEKRRQTEVQKHAIPHTEIPEKRRQTEVQKHRDSKAGPAPAARKGRKKTG